MGTPTNPEEGDLHIDASAVTPIELTKEQAASKVKLREGYDLAINCLTRLKAPQLAQSGINALEIQRCVTEKANYDQARSFLPAAEKLVSILKDTMTESGHQISLILSETSMQVRHRSERDSKAAEVLGIIEDLFGYVSGPAQKAAATRAKLAKAEAEAAEAAEAEAAAKEVAAKEEAAKEEAAAAKEAAPQDDAAPAKSG